MNAKHQATTPQAQCLAPKPLLWPASPKAGPDLMQPPALASPEDGLIDQEQVLRTEVCFAAGDSALHPLVRLGSCQSLVPPANGKPLDVDADRMVGQPRAPALTRASTRWKAGRGRVGDVMSIGYAEAGRCLLVQFGITEVTIATSEPFDTAWVAQIESHAQAGELVVANLLDVARFTTEFFTLAPWRAAVKGRAPQTLCQLEQLVSWARAIKALDANDQGVVQVVDWLWHIRLTSAPATSTRSSRREMGLIRLHRRRAAHGLPTATTVLALP